MRFMYLHQWDIFIISVDRMKLLMILIVTSCLLLLTISMKIDLDNGIALTELILPFGDIILKKYVSPSQGDASLIFRITTLVTNGLYDAVAPYHPTAVGIYTQHKHRMTEKNNRGKNIAILYASYHIIKFLFPNIEEDFGQVLQANGLDPNLEETDPYTPQGLGIIAAKNIIKNREDDGMNQYGDRGLNNREVKYNRVPYSDYTGYIPKNTPENLFDPSRWQPAIVSNGYGLFKAQKFVTPQLKNVLPYSFKDPKAFSVPPPKKSNILNFLDYYHQAEEVIETTANLTLQQKMKCQFFDKKVQSLAFPIILTSLQTGNSLLDLIITDFIANLAAFDSAIVVWQEKYKYDAVRPFSAIKYLWGNQTIRGWVGPGKGAVDDMPAYDWKSYINVADHPEYPSASATFCAATAEVARRSFKTDRMTFKSTIPAGSSTIEPGISPEQDFLISFPTWTAYEEDCANSRVWGGVHFPDAIKEGRKLGKKIGKIAYEYVMSFVNGNPRQPFDVKRRHN